MTPNSAETAPAVPPGFTCQRCGHCCLGPGDVRLRAGEVEAIAAWLGLTVSDFTDAFTRLTTDRQAITLTERPDGACIFLQPDNSCRIQAAKPQQCSAFPYLWRTARLANMCAGWKLHEYGN
jgi:Fe-S-cluster containining protein